MTDQRTILRITGDDRVGFLQGLVTNDIDRLSEGLVYTALLTPQGKLIVDFFLQAEGDAILLDVASDQAAALFQRLSMYKLRSAVEIAETGLVVSRGVGPAPEGALPDPRHPGMGWRLIDETDLSEEIDWDALRVEHVIPELGIEMSSDSFPLEVGLDRLSGVDFRKGCYVGQEVTARMKHKTELRKGLVQVRIEGVAPLGTPLMAGEKPAGTLYTQAGGKALAYLRFDRVKEPMQAGDATVTWTP
ncbi:MAG: folate-binding protein [Salibaculum sp.]|jgi:hypothetical protein|uniref:CAF17-like 4Fe-4S cluster assembly/insertion protein YgfZ n=1 Tax=Roseovarius halophilus (ex Wu et al. 2025) TaxID=3376060 RepID=UPI00287092F9|nr:folate-binding protein [Salibaculum sp.]MDR9427766.1 folate-binding protein [Salibaculum sp.]MDR9482558.1 folate-binding protein [Salibaculum sp.]